MRRTLQIFLFSSGILSALIVAQTATAQASRAGGDTPRVDIFLGYSYIRANSVVTGTPINLNGGSGSLAYDLNNWIGLVADGGFYRQGSVTANGLSLNISSFQAGPRISLRQRAHLIPFGQVLAGAGHATGTLYSYSLGPGLAPIGSNTRFMLTAGVGVDWKLTPTIGIRIIQAEYLYSQFLNGGSYSNEQNNVRLSAGIVLSFGAH
jgi:opacity protein-like surface antigen